MDFIRIPRLYESIDWSNISEKERQKNLPKLVIKSDWTLDSSSELYFLLNQYLYRFGRTNMSESELSSDTFNKNVIAYMIQDADRKSSLSEINPSEISIKGVSDKKQLHKKSIVSTGKKEYPWPNIVQAVSENMSRNGLLTADKMAKMICYLSQDACQDVLAPSDFKAMVAKKSEVKKGDTKKERVKIDLKDKELFNRYYKRLLFKFEGGVSKDPDDSQSKCSEPGKPHTNMGLGICTAKELFRQDKKRYGFLDKTGDNKVTWRDVPKWTEDDVKRVGYEQFWTYVGADRINHPLVAVLCSEWGWGSGPPSATKAIRRILNKHYGTNFKIKTTRLKQEEIDFINEQDGDEFFDILMQEREKNLIAISKLRNNKKYLKGWLRRLHELEEKMTTA